MTTIRLQGKVGALNLGRGQAMSYTNADFDVPSQAICGSRCERLAPAASGLFGDVALRTFMQKDTASASPYVRSALLVAHADLSTPSMEL